MKRTNSGYAMTVNAAARKAEINMYGEVVSDRPVDWWTGKPIDKQMIVLSEFLADFDELKGYDEIEIHLNSVGGDAFAGLAIYNRIKDLKATVTTINDSLCASAGSVIFMAGDVRKVRKASSIMIHCVSGFLFGFYNEADLRGILNELDTLDKNIATVYATEGNMSEDKALDAMRYTTWMTGEEAVKAGYADEVIEDAEDDSEELGVSMALDRSYMIARGGHKICAAWMPKELPEGIDIISESTADEPIDKTIMRGVSDEMEINTVEELREAYPELTDQLAADAQNAERTRIKGIYGASNNISDKAFVADAMFESDITPEAYAYKAVTENKITGNASVLAALETDTTESGASAVTAANSAAQNDSNVDLAAKEKEYYDSLTNAYNERRA